MANFEASTTDQSPAICVGDVTLPISDKEAKRLGVDASLSCMEVAGKTGFAAVLCTSIDGGNIFGQCGYQHGGCAVEQ